MSETSSETPAETPYEPRLQARYRDEVRAALTKDLKLTSPMQAPRLDKVVLSMGVGRAAGDSKKIRAALADLAAITGQKPVTTKARNSIAGFKLREGMAIGVMVTVRRAIMYEFVDRLVHVALPRVKDFRGLPRSSFDGNGNFAFGLREHFVFPEINYDQVDQSWGLNIVFTTSTRSDAHAQALLAAFGLPFR